MSSSSTSTQEKKDIRFVFIGHVDTGKSTLSGHLKYMCGHVSEHALETIKNKATKEGKERMLWSNINDIFEEEMEKGKTHEHHEEIFEYNNYKFHMIDTPGHLGFIREMIDGVSKNVNIGVLMVSAILNEFESSFERGMLKTHTMIAKVFGIKNLIVVINKMDKVNWDEKIYNDTKDKVKLFLNKHLNWKDDKIMYVPMSAYNGTGIMTTDGVPNWYTEESFINTLTKIPPKLRKFPTTFETGNTFGVDLKIFNVANFAITKNFKFVIHYQTYEEGQLISKEACATLKVIKDKETKLHKKILRQYDNALAVIQTDEPIKSFIKMCGLVRKNDETLGYFKTTKIGSM